MTQQEMAQRIQECAKQHQRANAVWKALEAPMGTIIASPLGEMIWDTLALYLRAVAESIGDDGDWLRWFVQSNDCGQLALKAKADAWDKPRKIRTAKQLAALIAADKLTEDAS
jgi:hypothetical protein